MSFAVMCSSRSCKAFQCGEHCVGNGGGPPKGRSGMKSSAGAGRAPNKSSLSTLCSELFNSGVLPCGTLPFGATGVTGDGGPPNARSSTSGANGFIARVAAIIMGCMSPSYFQVRTPWGARNRSAVALAVTFPRKNKQRCQAGDKTKRNLRCPGVRQVRAGLAGGSYWGIAPAQLRIRRSLGA
jgi:hypothetical protein